MHIKVSADQKLEWMGQSFPCAIGKGGIVSDKIEGDGGTPIGCFPLRYVLYRADRLFKPETNLNTQAVRTHDGWCDDPSHPQYNQAVVLPFPASHEELFRDDHIYDIIVVLGYNDDPPVAGKGSAIFFHLAKENYEPTEGCVALKLEHMLEVLKTVGPDTEMEIRH